jgi:hypothetical protein
VTRGYCEVSANHQRDSDGETHEDLTVIPVNGSYLTAKAINIIECEGGKRGDDYRIYPSGDVESEV